MSIASKGVVWLLWLAITVPFLWRALRVLRDRESLDAPAATGFVRWLWVLGLILATAGPIASAMQLVIPSLVHTLAPRGSDNGIEYFIIGLSVALVAALSPIGVLMFEFSRLRGFEQALRGSGNDVCG